MPVFNYSAYDKSGVKIDDTIEANSIEEAKGELLKQGLLVSSLKPHVVRQSFSLFPQKVTLAEMEFLIAELAILLDSGVKIDKGLAIINKSQTSPVMSVLVEEVLQNLRQGKTVAESFDTKDKTFDPLYINLISIGELSGKLPEVFAGLAADLKFRKELRSKVIQALTYPAVIFFVCIACILFVFNYIVPQMAGIFSDMDELPIYTKALLGLSEWMVNYQWLLFTGVGLGIGLIYANRDNQQFKLWSAKNMLGWPVVSSLIKQVERIRFNSAMALMLNAGLKVDNAIGLACNNINNSVIQSGLRVAHEKITKGSPVASSLGQSVIFPDFYVSLLEVGEESGRLGDIFQEIAQRSKQDFENWTDKVTNMLEPLLILVMGGIVGSVVVTMLLSVVTVNDISI